MVRIGKLANRQTMAVISDMSQPLGEAIGNSLEIVEAIETLQGNGPEDLVEMCYVLGSQMVVLAKSRDVRRSTGFIRRSINKRSSARKI